MDADVEEVEEKTVTSELRTEVSATTFPPMNHIVCFTFSYDSVVLSPSLNCFFPLSKPLPETRTRVALTCSSGSSLRVSLSNWSGRSKIWCDGVAATLLNFGVRTECACILIHPFVRYCSFSALLGELSECDEGSRANAWGQLMVKAVATLENRSLVQGEKGHDGFGLKANEVQISEELEEGEKLRRLRISKANKGNTPWNKGRKHSAETLRRIKERTRLAMQDPKVKMKLANQGHAQSEETKLKIGVGVRMGWERRRQRLLLQEMCHFEWLNLIADGSRRGYSGEDELQWDSYKLLDEHLGHVWVESVEQRKKTPRVPGSRRAPKSIEQRRKIAEAISAKWSDPDYRNRVCSALAKFHGTPDGIKRKPRRIPHDPSQSRSSAKKTSKDGDSLSESELKVLSAKAKLKKSNVPKYKDPLASSKLEMIKNIRAQRAAADTKKTEAIERARLMIAKAERAAKALEATASTDPHSMASLIETKKLIKEAKQSIESIDATSLTSLDITQQPPEDSDEHISLIMREMDMVNRVNGAEVKINGTSIHTFSDNKDSHYTDLTAHGFIDDEEEVVQKNSNGHASVPQSFSSSATFFHFNKQHQTPASSQTIKCHNTRLLNGAHPQTDEHETLLYPSSKKWVCGRLVNVSEEGEEQDDEFHSH
ncbi:unnamed protein product [Rhodiola kirilowii]